MARGLVARVATCCAGVALSACSGAGATVANTGDERNSYLWRHSAPPVESFVALDYRHVAFVCPPWSLFSNDGGHSWHRQRGPLWGLSLAAGGQLWSLYHSGSPHHGVPLVGLVSYSVDRGYTWRQVDLAPSAWEPDCGERLPVAFINAPERPPLLMTINGQLWRPVVGADSSGWKRLGQPAFPDIPCDPNAAGTGIEDRGLVYLADIGRTIALSADQGISWTRVRIDDTRGGLGSVVRCHGDRCYALVGGRYLYVSPAGRNSWTPVAWLEPGRVHAVLKELSPRNQAVSDWAFEDMLPGEDGIVFTGFTYAERKAEAEVDRGLVLRLRPDGTLEPLGRLTDEVLYHLIRGPDGTLWGTGTGLFRFEAGIWRRLFPR